MDLNQVYAMIDLSADNSREDQAETILNAPKDVIQSRAKTFFLAVAVDEIKTPEPYWKIPKSLYPEKGKAKALIIYKGERPIRVVLYATAPTKEIIAYWTNAGFKTDLVTLEFTDKKPTITAQGQQAKALSKTVPLVLAGSIPFKAKVEPNSLDHIENADDVLFEVSLKIQDLSLDGSIPLGTLLFSKAEIKKTIPSDTEQAPFWVYQSQDKTGQNQLVLPSDSLLGDGVILPRTFRDAGVLVGDRGYISYVTPTTSSIQEQRTPIFVAGFYDPGVIPIGGKYILVNQQVTSLIRSSHNQEDLTLTNGINVRLDQIEQAVQVKAELQKALNKLGIDSYWKVETYKDYDFTRDLIQQLQSEKNLFTLLATIIIIVACSNIISMLIILVNDKKLEIGIMRSMGATSFSIAAIFGICGVIMGVVGSVIGTLAAVVTLHNLQPLVNLISRIQGFDMFNPLFFGEKLPSELSYEALGFVVVATAVISLIAGLVPAIKASMMKPSATLRAE
jgi:lipoprotein-releasing system permease protein